jgi:MFS family permease
MDDSPRPLTQEATRAAVSPTEPPSTPDDARRRHSALLIIFLVVFIDLLGFGIVLPLLPLYADDILEPLYPGPAREPLRGALLGLLMASFSAMQFFFAPVWGRLSDRIGRRPILLLGLAGSVVFYSLFGIASEVGAIGWLGLALTLLFVSRLGAGVAGATISTAQAVIADTTPPEKRSRGMALIGAAFGIGFTFGPLFGFASLFVPYAGAPGFMAAALSLGAFVLGLLLLPETRRAETGQSLRRRVFDWEGTKRVLATPSIGILVLTFFLATVAFGGLESTLALVNRLLITGEELSREARQQLLTREAARTTERANFLVFAYVGFVLMLTQGFFYRRFAARVGEVRFMRTGVALMIVGLAGAVAILLLRKTLDKPALWTVALVDMSLAVIGFAFLTPSVQSLISRRGDPARQGEVLGVNQSGAALARILGPLVGLILFDLLPSHVLPYAFGAVLLVIVLVLTLQVRQA